MAGATVKVMLIHGLKLKDSVSGAESKQLEAELQEPDAGILTDVRIASERLMSTERGPMLVPSPSIARRELLRRQIVRIGSIPGAPLSEELFRMLKASDLALLEQGAIELDEAALSEVAQRGRRPTAG